MSEALGNFYSWRGNLIGLWGYGGVGKDTIQKILLKEGGFVRAAYGDQLRDDCNTAARAIGLNLDFWDDKTKRECRDFMVGVAETAKKIDPYHWVKRAVLPPSPQACITDVRDVPDFDGIYNHHKGLVFEIVRTGIQPANSTEQRTFTAIRLYAHTNQIHIPQVTNRNDDPERAAREILSYAQRYFAKEQAA